MAKNTDTLCFAKHVSPWTSPQSPCLFQSRIRDKTAFRLQQSSGGLDCATNSCSMTPGMCWASQEFRTTNFRQQRFSDASDVQSPPLTIGTNQPPVKKQELLQTINNQYLPTAGHFSRYLTQQRQTQISTPWHGTQVFQQCCLCTGCNIAHKRRKGRDELNAAICRGCKERSSCHAYTPTVSTEESSRSSHG